MKNVVVLVWLVDQIAYELAKRCYAGALRRKKRFDVESIVSDCQENVAFPPLWQPQGIGTNELMGYAIPQSCQVFETLLYHGRAVVDDGTHVFNEHHFRLEELDRPDHAQVQAVPGVIATCVVVEIRMPLARRSRNEDIDWADRFSKSSPGSTRTIAQITGQNVVDVGQTRDVGREAKVVAIDANCVRRVVDRQANVESPSIETGSLPNAESEAATSAEQIDKADCAAR